MDMSVTQTGAEILTCYVSNLFKFNEMNNSRYVFKQQQRNQKVSNPKDTSAMNPNSYGRGRFSQS